MAEDDPHADADTTVRRRPTGTIRDVVASRGFGFLIGADDGVSRFFHRTMCITPFELLHDGVIVYFTPDDDSPAAKAKGPRATDIQKLRVTD